jgi:hypothetical protein
LASAPETTLERDDDCGQTLRVLVACEFSGVVREAFRARGHDAWSCDLLPSEQDGQHLQCDVLDVLADGWDLLVAHPPCTVLARSGARWWNGREAEQSLACDFVLALWNAPIPRAVIENPIGRLNQLWRYPDQTIEPFYFGEPYAKRTCLWLRGVPPLMATCVVAEHGPWVQANYVTRVSRTRRLAGPARKAKDRSRTLPGVAAAMAGQWG